jgi:hypothetical protein
MPLPPRPVDRNRVENEARAKILWGDSRQEVIAFMVVSGIDRAEATEFVDEVLSERAKSIRAAGLRRIFIGIPLICVPFGAWIYFMAIHMIFVWPFAFTIMAGLYGIWSLITGLVMFISPKTESGDVGEK